MWKYDSGSGKLPLVNLTFMECLHLGGYGCSHINWTNSSSLVFNPIPDSMPSTLALPSGEKTKLNHGQSLLSLIGQAVQVGANKWQVEQQVKSG